MTELLSSLNGLSLVAPVCDLGIEDVILKPDSDKLIDGVRIQPMAVWPDDRGYFLEIVRNGQGLITQFPAESTQVSAALSYPGTIKAFHYHLEQTDCWSAALGMFRFTSGRSTSWICDLRPS